MFELTYNWGRESYKHGNAYAQVAIGTDVRQGVGGGGGRLKGVGTDNPSKGGEGGGGRPNRVGWRGREVSCAACQA